MNTNYDADDDNGIANEGEPSRTSIRDVCLLISAILIVGRACPEVHGGSSLVEGIVHLGVVLQVCAQMWICDWNVHF
jgi:hypothetical protein